MVVSFLLYLPLVRWHNLVVLSTFLSNVISILCYLCDNHNHRLLHFLSQLLKLQSFRNILALSHQGLGWFLLRRISRLLPFDKIHPRIQYTIQAILLSYGEIVLQKNFWSKLFYFHPTHWFFCHYTKYLLLLREAIFMLLERKYQDTIFITMRWTPSKTFDKSYDILTKSNIASLVLNYT